MKYRKPLTFLIAVIVLASAFSAITGLISTGGPGIFEYESIRGFSVQIHGSGLYKHMSHEVAIQGIAQDLITLLIAIPALIVSFIYSIRGSLKARLIFAGTSFYFFVTYLMYQLMAMYNGLFLLYVLLTGSSFLVLLLTFYPLNMKEVKDLFASGAKSGFGGIFLILNGTAITILWLGVVIPPILNGTIYPPEVEHYTTLVVQAIDLSLLLPLSFILGYLLYKRTPEGFVYGTCYLVFLTFLMTALLSKIIYMGAHGYQIIPAIFIIPLLLILSGTGTFFMLKDFAVNIKK